MLQWRGDPIVWEWTVDVLTMYPGSGLSLVLVHLTTGADKLRSVGLLLLFDHLVVLGIGLPGSGIQINKGPDLLEIRAELVRGDELVALKMEL